MGNRFRQSQKTLTLILGATTWTLLWLPGSVYAQSQTTAAQQTTATQDRQGGQSDDITRKDLARFDQFLDSHRETAQQLRKTPSLIDDPQFLKSHPELNTYLQQHPSVKQEISQRPDTFMRLEDEYNHDQNARNRDASWQGQDADRRDGMNRDEDRRDGDNRDRRDVASFDRFLNDHREIADQARKDPSLLDNRSFVDSHQALQSYLQDNPGVRDQLRQNPNAFMQQVDTYNHDQNAGNREPGGQDRNYDRRDNDRRDVASFGRFLDDHREIGEQVRKDPSLLDNRGFVDSHPALQTYLQNDPGVRDQLRQNPNAFMQQVDAYNHDQNAGNRDPMHDHMAAFGGFLGSHSDIQKDLSRDPSVVKDHDYVQDHAELNAYLTAHPDVRGDLMANPQGFVHGAQQYNSGGSATGTTSGAGMNGRGTGTPTGTTTGATTGTSTNPATTTHETKPNQ